MYQEKKSGVNWLKVILKFFIMVLVVLLFAKLIMLFLSNHKAKVIENVMTDNLNKMNEVAKDYFVDDKVPAKVGDTSKASLKELINDKAIEEIKDQAGKKCDYEKSYIQITKLDNDYQYKSYLVCGSVTKFKNTYKSEKQDDIISTLETTKKTKKTTEKTTKKTTKTTTTTTKTTTTSTSTTKVTTTAKVEDNKVEVSFNTNGGSLIDSIKIEKGTKLSEAPKTTREGYTFVGWFYHGQAYNFDTPINDNLVLVAKWR